MTVLRRCAPALSGFPSTCACCSEHTVQHTSLTLVKALMSGSGMRLHVSPQHGLRRRGHEGRSEQSLACRRHLGSSCWPFPMWSRLRASALRHAPASPPLPASADPCCTPSAHLGYDVFCRKAIGPSIKCENVHVLHVMHCSILTSPCCRHWGTMAAPVRAATLVVAPVLSWARCLAAQDCPV